MKTILLVALLSSQYIGDNSNALGIRAALNEGYKNKGFEVENVDIKIEELKNTQINTNQAEKQVIFIGAGLDGIKGFDILKSMKNNSKFIWSGHQLPVEVKDNLEVLDTISLPFYALNEEQKTHIKQANPEIKLIETIGIPHNLTREECINDYNDFKNNGKIPASPNGYIITCLAGDAQDSQRNIKFYTEDEAYELGKQLAKIAKDKNMILLATNGPRTGQYNPETKAKLSVHKQEDQLDKVSQKFLEGVKSEKIEPIFENFVFGVKSVFNGYLGAALENPQSIVIIPGEFSTQVTIGTNLLPGQVYIKPNQAMNDIHELQVNKLLEKGIKIFNGDEKALTPYPFTIIPNDANIIAEQFIESNDTKLMGDIE
ncbi:hypothetical protein H6P87_00781 [Rickettsia tillamookensis]|uniref:Uncharacterized protein n=1 Tax=Rickettsia tillamookensis TaxID=2761623 RepID=A0A9E6MI64_9RICK|nr:hypothetical protein [Rickettsia tillamookensis]QQV75232.1 hypothetical protein H6P87_00781 [Rickettsia tillamookensis]